MDRNQLLAARRAGRDYCIRCGVTFPAWWKHKCKPKRGAEMEKPFEDCDSCGYWRNADPPGKSGCSRHDAVGTEDDGHCSGYKAYAKTISGPAEDALADHLEMEEVTIQARLPRVIIQQIKRGELTGFSMGGVVGRADPPPVGRVVGRVDLKGTEQQKSWTEIDDASCRICGIADGTHAGDCLVGKVDNLEMNLINHAHRTIENQKALERRWEQIKRQDLPNLESRLAMNRSTVTSPMAREIEEHDRALQGLTRRLQEISSNDLVRLEQRVKRLEMRADGYDPDTSRPLDDDAPECRRHEGVKFVPFGSHGDVVCPRCLVNSVEDFVKAKFPIAITNKTPPKVRPRTVEALARDDDGSFKTLKHTRQDRGVVEIAPIKTPDDVLEELIDRAIECYGDEGDGLFTYANFDHAYREMFGRSPSMKEQDEILGSCTYVRQDGPSMWQKIKPQRPESSFVQARRVMRDTFAKDSDLRRGYVDNVAMRLHDMLDPDSKRQWHKTDVLDPASCRVLNIKTRNKIANAILNLIFDD